MSYINLGQDTTQTLANMSRRLLSFDLLNVRIGEKPSRSAS